jgi:RNA recognition motif-containing protein
MNYVNQSNTPSTGEYKKVYVSKIPPGLSDSFMMKLLETCGSVSEWKRMTDQNGRARNWGLCEFHSVESMLKCLRLLNNLKLEEGYELLVKYFNID